MTTERIKVVGMDVSLNHAAFVELTNGVMTNFAYITDTASGAKKSKRGTRMVLVKTKDPAERSLIRLSIMEHYIDKTILQGFKPDYCVLEDYALRESHGAHQIGEIGGIARILVWFRGLKLRLHDPVSVKMFITGDGTAKKDAVLASVRDQWGVDFTSMVNGADTRSAEDLADAWGLAMMGWTEIQLRSGKIRMDSLTEKQIRVFHRITKHQPVDLLNREWLQNPNGKPTPHGKMPCKKCNSTSCCLAVVPKVKAVS